MLEILIFGAMALLLAVKLRSILGQECDSHPTQGKHNDRAKDVGMVVGGVFYGNKAGSAMGQPQGRVGESAHAKADKAVLTFDAKFITKDAFDHFVTLTEHLPHLTPEYFVRVSKEVLGELLSAYASGNTETVNTLMAPDLAAKTVATMLKIKERGCKMFLVLVGSDVAQITKVSIVNDVAAVSVHFISKQIYYIEDKDGKMISGDKAAEYEVSELWTFKKNIKDSDNNTWLVSEIGSIV